MRISNSVDIGDVYMNWNWNETTLDFPFSSKNLKNLLNTVCRKENRFSQYELIKWCDNLTMAFEEEEAGEFNEIAFGIAREIECQWDLFLVNTYSLKELQNLDPSKVKLPQNWFIEWLEQLNEK